MRRKRIDAEILDVARELTTKGLVVGTTGNVSARDGFTIRMTPTRTPYETMRRADLVTSELRDAEPPPGASLEWGLHVAIYRRRPDISAIVHTHSPWATAWSCLGGALVPELEEASYYDIGPLRTITHGPTGSLEQVDATAAAVAEARAVLLAGHGVLALAGTPRSALTVAEAVEHQAHVALLVRMATAVHAALT